jgi:5-methylthioadenosine/S-adenosylhomocysteine deaminase
MKLRPRSCLLVLATTASLVCSCATESAPGGRNIPDNRTVADLLVLGGTVVTMNADRQVIRSGAVAAIDGEIVAVGPAAEVSAAYRAETVVTPGDYDLVVPGLVNGHNHAAMSLLRGVADDLALMQWLERYIFPAEAALVDEGFVRIGTQLAALEMISGGTTTFADMYYFEDIVAEVVESCGLRGVLGETIVDFPAPDNASAEEALRYTEMFLQRWQDNPRVVAAVAPHAAFTAGPETLRSAAELARRYGAPLLIHVAETGDEVEQVRQRYGVRPVEHLASLGFLGPDVIAAHVIWVNDEEIALLAEHSVGAVHNPESNMKLASGTMPLIALRAAGVAVGLGTDGPASNNDLDMFAAMTTATFLQKHANADPTALPAAETLALATIEGARALGLEEQIGSLEVGKRADLVVVSGEPASMVPLYDPYSHLVYAARGAEVRLTVVDGRILYRDGRFLTLDVDTVKAAARAVAERVAAATGGESGT